MVKGNVSKESYEDLLDREKRFRSILEKTQYGFFIVGEEQNFIDVNDAYCKMTGYTKEEFLNLKLSDIDFNKNPQEKKVIKEKLMNKGQAILETIHLKKTGEVFDVEVSISLLNQEPIEALCFCRDITDKKKDRKEIIEMKERLENIIEGTNAGTWVHYIKTDKEIVNERWAEIIGYELKEITPIDMNTLKKITHPKDLEIVQREFQKTINQEKEYYDVEFRIKHKKGKWIWINSRGKITKWSKDGTPFQVSGTTIDITEKKQDEQKIIEMKERLENIIEGTNAGSWEIDLETGDASIDIKWADMLGYKLEELLPVNEEKWKSLIYNKDLEKVEREIQKIINQEIEYYDIEFRMKHKNGKIIWVNGRGKISKMSEDGKLLFISGISINITEKKEKQEQIEYLSFHDTLTGLYNRRYMEDSIKRLDTDRNLPFSIIAADVDGLKLINDTYGHDMGDKLLITAAEILKRSCRKEDIVCRVGGDEFLILLPNIDEKKVNEIIERIKKESENTGFDSSTVSLAIGYSTKNKKEKNILEVYKEADNNMYKSKLKYGRIMRNKTIEKVLENVNKRHYNEKIHSGRVSKYCESIAKAMNLSKREIEDAKSAGKLHDIGKIVVSPEILKKESKLTDEEREEFKKHSTISYHLLKSIDKYSHLSKAVLYHHERLDGSGYPEKLKDKEIPLLSKIIAVADTYEAMTASNSSKNNKTKEEAVEELKKQSGIKFDKDILDVFINKVV